MFEKNQINDDGVTGPIFVRFPCRFIQPSDPQFVVNGLFLWIEIDGLIFKTSIFGKWLKSA